MKRLSHWSNLPGLQIVHLKRRFLLRDVIVGRRRLLLDDDTGVRLPGRRSEEKQRFGSHPSAQFTSFGTACRMKFTLYAAVVLGGLCTAHCSMLTFVTRHITRHTDQVTPHSGPIGSCTKTA